jgi:DNA-binding NarL/FixJ family response regulator
MRPIPKPSIGVLIADDSAAVCKLITHLLQRERSTHIVGVAGNLEVALHLAVEYTPDVLLLDLHLDDLVGHDPLSVKIGFLSSVRHIVAMSTRSDDEERQFAQLYGASRLVDKFFLSEQLISTILSCGRPERPLAATPPRRRQHHALNRWAS